MTSLVGDPSYEYAHLGMRVAPSMPDSRAPIMNGLVALRFWRSTQHVVDSQAGTLTRYRKGWPLSLFMSQLHVRALNLATAEAPLEMEMKTYQREGHFDRLVVGRSVLRCKSVDCMLMDEIYAAVSQRVVGQLVKRIQ